MKQKTKKQSWIQLQQIMLRKELENKSTLLYLKYETKNSYFFRLRKLFKLYKLLQGSLSNLSIEKKIEHLALIKFFGLSPEYPFNMKRLQKLLKNYFIRKLLFLFIKRKD